MPTSGRGGPCLRDLCDVRDRHLQARDELERQALYRLIELGRGDEQRKRRRFARVEPARELEHRLIALRAHALCDLADIGFDRRSAGYERAQVARNRR